MPRTIKHVEQRVMIMKMLLEIIRVYCGAYFAGKRHGSCAGDLMLLAAIFVGQAEGRPMNPSKLAEFAGLPRPTVIRKMKHLEREGVLDQSNGAYNVRPSRVNGDAALSAVMASSRLIVNTAARLSKMDTKGVAQPTSWAICLATMICG